MKHFNHINIILLGLLLCVISIGFMTNGETKEKLMNTSDSIKVSEEMVIATLGAL